MGGARRVRALSPTHHVPNRRRAIAHGVFYPPTNSEFAASEGELPPLIVEVHGGPTSHVYPRLAANFAF